MRCLLLNPRERITLAGAIDVYAGVSTMSGLTAQLRANASRRRSVYITMTSAQVRYVLLALRAHERADDTGRHGALAGKIAAAAVRSQS